MQIIHMFWSEGFKFHAAATHGDLAEGLFVGDNKIIYSCVGNVFKADLFISQYIKASSLKGSTIC